MIGRAFLLIVTNIVIIITLSIIASVLGLNRYAPGGELNYQALFAFCLFWGLAASFISLAISRWVAKKFLKIKLYTMEEPGDYAWLVAMVHDLAKRANLPEMPEVGVWESEDVNAFATGPTKSRSLVAFSSTLLEKMNREQVGGVAAHDVAHIMNGDMVTMVLIQGVINAFVMFFARIVAYAASNAVDEKLSRIVWWVTLHAFHIIFGILAAVITCWFSRRREYRADAGSAALGGRQAMVSALEALLTLEDRKREAQMPASMAALGISGKSWLNAWSTHPRLEARIEALKKFA